MLLGDLPNELQVLIFLHLSAGDLAQCMRLNKHMASVIKKSLSLRYHILLDMYGMEDNTACFMEITDKIEALHLREEAYLHFKYRFRQEMTVGAHEEMGIYDLSSGTYFLGGPSYFDQLASRSIRLLKLPSEAGQQDMWSEINVDKPIIDFATSPGENDLVAFITSTASPNLTELYVDVDLYQLSTGQAHPAAQQQHFRIQQAPLSLARPTVSVEVVGDVLAAITCYYSGVDESHQHNAHSRLFLFFWKTGTPINPGGHPIRNVGLCFLTPQLLLHPNEHTRALDVFHIPDAPTSTSRLALVCELKYPEFRPVLSITHTVCRGEPNPAVNRCKQDATRPFRSRAEDAIIIVDMALDFGNDMFKTFALIFHRSTVLRHASRAQGGTSVPWEDWGPIGARWLCTKDMNIGFITVSSGQRYVQMPSTTFVDQAIHILDFNPYTVRRVEAEIVERGADADADEYRRLAIDTRTATIVLPCDHRPGQPWTRVDPSSDLTAPPSDTSKSHNDFVNVKDMEAKSYIDLPIQVYGNTRPAEVSTNMESAFADARALQPGLPFVRTVSKQDYLYDSVLMDDERVVGLSMGKWTF
ncbi:hypothetical protein BD626DRAFT_562683 [Schizophyllum amplum]|uniref:F-box domain-containing protein n=1 Tax=Schizophyllum amplum TaxID=97359 RepID=A0A550CVP2_9AGAR|nr:hypothetical protein BD626DRAFT_562683 [Auriculariopsis ampla]